MPLAPWWALGCSPRSGSSTSSLGPADGVVVGGITVLPRTSDLAMPHLWVMFARVFEPVTGASTALPMWLAVLQACLFTLGIAAVGWLVGVTVGLALALLMQRFRLAEVGHPALDHPQPDRAADRARPARSALGRADRVRRVHLGELDVGGADRLLPRVLPGVDRRAARPERSRANHVDLMHCYAVGWWKTLWRLRLPASVGYLLPALRLAAASAVIGTVVAEVSIGLRGGIGRMIVEYAGAAGSDPGKPWAPIFGSVLVGLVAAGFVALIGLFLRRFRRGEVAA